MPSSAQIVAALRLASTLHQHSDQLRLRSRSLSEAGAHLRWQSPAMTLFAHQLTAVIASLDHCVGRFDLACQRINELAVVG